MLMSVSPILLSGSLALGISLGLVLLLGLMSLLNGALHVLFVRPKLTLLKSDGGKNSLAFALSYEATGEEASFDSLSLSLYNPFGTPPHQEISRSFEEAKRDFARAVDMGPGLSEFLRPEGREASRARVTLNISSTRDGLSYSFEMTVKKFKEQLEKAQASIKDIQGEGGKIRPLYQEVSREFIAPPLGEEAHKILKIPTNPVFAPDFLGLGQGKGAEATEAQENFAVKKVWIAPGCIVCDACESIYPEVFDVQDETCIIRPNAPLDNGLLIEEAAEACPVEVIKFERA